MTARGYCLSSGGVAQSRMSFILNCTFVELVPDVVSDATRFRLFLKMIGRVDFTREMNSENSRQVRSE